jgi:hypothetical protein
MGDKNSLKYIQKCFSVILTRRLNGELFLAALRTSRFRNARTDAGGLALADALHYRAQTVAPLRNGIIGLRLNREPNDGTMFDSDKTPILATGFAGRVIRMLGCVPHIPMLGTGLMKVQESSYEQRS